MRAPLDPVRTIVDDRDVAGDPEVTTSLLPISIGLPGRDSLTVRAVRDDDVDGLIVLYAGLSDTDRRRRFFTQYRATRAWVVDWLRRCRERGASIVAEVETTGELVGEAAYVLQPNGDGDFSLTVDSAWRGWLGPYLLDVLVEVAAANGVPNLEADILTENRAMQAIVRRRGAVVGGDSDHTVVHVVIGTGDRIPRWPERTERPRILVEVPGGRWRLGPELARAGFEVLGCPGPERRHEPCPALAGEPCPLAGGADAIVVAMPPGTAEQLQVAHRRLHPAVPLVIAGGGGTDSPSDDCRLAAGAASAELLTALEQAMRSGPIGERSEDLRHSTPGGAGARDDVQDTTPEHDGHRDRSEP